MLAINGVTVSAVELLVGLGGDEPLVRGQVEHVATGEGVGHVDDVPGELDEGDAGEHRQEVVVGHPLADLEAVGHERRLVAVAEPSEADHAAEEQVHPRQGSGGPRDDGQPAQAVDQPPATVAARGVEGQHVGDGGVADGIEHAEHGHSRRQYPCRKGVRRHLILA